MRVVIQRVQGASVSIDGQVVGQIGTGLLTLLGIAKGDTPEQAIKTIEKIVHLRIFEDNCGKMNLSLKEMGGAHLIVSQFTLLADCSKGKRPGFSDAEHPDRARELYEFAVSHSRQLGIPTQTGRFGASMQVTLTNDGPITLTWDERKIIES